MRAKLALATALGAASVLAPVLPARAEIPLAGGQPIYFARDTGGFVVQGRRESWHYDEILKGMIVDGKAHYLGRRSDQVCIVTGTKEHVCRDAIDAFHTEDGHTVYSFHKQYDDGKRIAFFGVDGTALESGYPEIKLLRYVGGKPLFAATDGAGQWFVVEGKAAGPPFEDITYLSHAAGRPLYAGKRGGKLYVSYGTRLLGPYDYVEGLDVVGGEPIFAGRRGDRQWVLAHGDAVMGPFVKTPVPFLVADGRPLFAARDGRDNRDVLMHGSQELARCRSVTEVQYVGGKPLYACHQSEGSYAVFGAKRYGPFSGVSNLQVAGDEPLFLAGYLHATAVRHGESATAPQGLTNTHGKLFFGNGRPVYLISRDGGRYRHLVFGDYVSPFFDGIDEMSLTFQGDKPVFAGWRGSRRYVVQGQQERGPYDGILGRIAIVDGQPLYLVANLRKEYVVHGDKTEGPYDRIWELSVVQGKLLYFARRGCREFVVFGGVEGKPYRAVATEVPESALALANRTCAE